MVITPPVPVSIVTLPLVVERNANGPPVLTVKLDPKMLPTLLMLPPNMLITPAEIMDRLDTLLMLLLLISTFPLIVSVGVVMDKAVALEMLLNPVMLPVPVSPENKNPLTVPVPMPVKLETPVMLLEFNVKLPLLILTDPLFAGFMLILHDAARLRL
jgi:hypothetical protein